MTDAVAVRALPDSRGAAIDLFEDWSTVAGELRAIAIIDFVEFLDRVGYDEAWIGEHYSGAMEIISSPELFIAAAAERRQPYSAGHRSDLPALPNPLIIPDRIVQLDHQTRGRAMFGFGPGQLPADALKIGIPADEQRAWMADAGNFIVRLLAGDTVTRTTDWYPLREAALHVGPFTRPRPHPAVGRVSARSSGTAIG